MRSKVLVPALRVGYIVASPAVIDPLARVRGVCDMQGDTVVECAIAIPRSVAAACAEKLEHEAHHDERSRQPAPDARVRR